MTTKTGKHLLTVDEYCEAAQPVIPTPDERAELLNGEIVGRSPTGDQHSMLVRQILPA